MHDHRRLGATRPLFSMLAVLIGGLAALVFIPQDDWQQVGALRVSGALMISGLLFSVVVAIFKNPIALFRAELILMVGLVYWLVFDAVQANYPLSADRDAVVFLFVGVTVFGAFFWFGTAVASPFGRTTELRHVVADVGPSFVFWAAIVCALMGLSYKTLSCHLQVSCLYEGLMGARFSGWALDPAFAPLKRLRYGGYLALPLTVAYFILVRRVTWRGAIVTALSLLNVVLLLMDGRRAMGTTIGAGILIYVLLQPRIRFRHLVALASGAAVLLLIMEAMLAWRNIGFGRAFAEDLPVDTRPGIISVDRNLFHATRAISLVPSAHPHTGFDGIAYTFGHIIPRSIWHRPPKFGFDYIGASMRRGRLGWTATFSVIGDLWVIGGWIALAAGGIFYGVLSNLASRLLLQPVSIRSRLLYTAAVMALFISFRAMFELVITGLAVLTLFLLFMFRDWVLERARVPAPAR